MGKKKEGEVLITNVQPNIKKDLQAIAKHQGITLSSFLKPKLREIVNQYPDSMKVRRD